MAGAEQKDSEQRGENVFHSFTSLAGENCIDLGNDFDSCGERFEPMGVSQRLMEVKRTSIWRSFPATE